MKTVLNAKTAWIFGTLGAIAALALMVYVYHATDPAAQAPIATQKYDMATQAQRDMGEQIHRDTAIPDKFIPGTVVGESKP